MDEHNEKHYWIDVALANTLPHFALEQTTQLLFLHNFDVMRAHLDNVHDGENGNVTLLRMLVSPVNGAKGDDATFDLLKQELKRSKWLSPATMELVYEKQPWIGIRRGEIITAMCTVMHPVKSKENSILFSKGNILDTVTKDRYVNHAVSIADLFLDRFNPKNPLSDQELEERSAGLRAVIDNEVEDTPAQELLLKMIGQYSTSCRSLTYSPLHVLTLSLHLDSFTSRHCQVHTQNKCVHEQPLCTWPKIGPENYGFRCRSTTRLSVWDYLCPRAEV